MAFIRKMMAQHCLTVSADHTSQTWTQKAPQNDNKRNPHRRHSNDPDADMIIDGICRHLHQGGYQLIIYLRV